MQRTACSRRSRGKAQGDGGRRLRFSAGAAASGGNSGQGDAMAPVVLTGMRGRNIESAQDTVPLHHPEVAPDVAILREAQNRYVA